MNDDVRKFPATHSLWRSRRQRGQSLVEFALVFPIFIVLVMGIIDFGMALKSWIDITNAAREAARWGAIYCNTGYGNPVKYPTDADVAQKARDKAAAMGVNLSRFTATVDTTAGSSCSDRPNSTEPLVVRVSYDYELITPLGGFLDAFFGGVISSSFKLKSAADMRIE